MLARPLRNAASIARGLSRATSAAPCFSTSTPQPKEKTSTKTSCQTNLLKDPHFLSTSSQAGITKRWYGAEASWPPHHKVPLPALSPTMEHGTIVSWEKKEGDQVSEGDLLCEIETDKATMGFETPEEGYLAKILLPGGSKDVPIGKLLCIIVSNKEDVEKFKTFKGEDAASSVPTPVVAATVQQEESSAIPPPKTKPIKPSQPSTAARVPPPVSSDRAFASPAAKKVASEKGVDLSKISSGSGMDGMITSRDVENFIASGAGDASPPSILSTSVPFAGGLPSGVYSDAELTNMRKTIAKRLQASKQIVPHYYLTVDCQMDAILKLRAELNAQNEKEGVKLSVNDFIIKATALASKKVPECNSAWMDTFIREYHSCDVSVAVDTGNGLITPIVTSAERKGLAEISSTVKELAGKAKSGKLQPHEFMGGTITVSNLGMFGISHFTAIINSPQSCILAVGGTSKKVIPSGNPDSPYKTANMMSVTLSCDHRVVDGAVGSQWLKHFKKYMENPTSMLL